MARKSTMSIVAALLCLLTFSTQSTLCQPDLKLRDIDKQLWDKLMNKGYGAMAVFGLGEYLDHLLISAPSELTTNITAITVFCPTDEGFISQNHIGIPTTLLKYHVIPFKVDKKTLQSSPLGSTFPTLLANAPPLVRTRHNNKTSINDVKIMNWEIYNDGKLIVHGVDAYFNPAFAVVYPGRVAKHDCAECKKINLDDHHNDHEIPKGLSNCSSGNSLLVLAVIVLAVTVIGLSCHRYFYEGRHDDHLPVKTSGLV